MYVTAKPKIKLDYRFYTNKMKLDGIEFTRSKTFKERIKVMFELIKIRKRKIYGIYNKLELVMYEKPDGTLKMIDPHINHIINSMDELPLKYKPLDPNDSKMMKILNLVDEKKYGLKFVVYKTPAGTLSYRDVMFFEDVNDSIVEYIPFTGDEIFDIFTGLISFFDLHFENVDANRFKKLPDSKCLMELGEKGTIEDSKWLYDKNEYLS